MTSPCHHCGTETETTQTSEGANDIFKCVICGKLKGVVTATDKINMVKKPCPFKHTIYPYEKVHPSGLRPPETDMSRPEDGCRVQQQYYICVKEENCPIYNGGMK